jgi:hypothetical protein
MRGESGAEGTSGGFRTLFRAHCKTGTMYETGQVECHAPGLSPFSSRYPNARGEHPVPMAPEAGWTARRLHGAEQTLREARAGWLCRICGDSFRTTARPSDAPHKRFCRGGANPPSRTKRDDRCTARSMEHPGFLLSPGEGRTGLITPPFKASYGLLPPKKGRRDTTPRPVR